jgi:hypothetical protein
VCKQNGICLPKTLVNRVKNTFDFMLENNGMPHTKPYTSVSLRRLRHEFSLMEFQSIGTLLIFRLQNVVAVVVVVVVMVVVVLVVVAAAVDGH